MQEYKSKTVVLQRDATTIFSVLSDMNLLAQAISKVPSEEIENIESTTDTCSFTIRGVNAGIQILEREPHKVIKYSPYGNSPMDFLMWIQIVEKEPYKSYLRIVLHVELNMAMNLMLKGKIQKGLDKMVDQISNNF